MKNKKYILFFLLTLALLLVVKLTESPPVDWSENFTKDDKIPFGSYILFDQIEKAFPGGDIKIAAYPVYNMLHNKRLKNSNYIFINDRFEPDELDLNDLLKFVEKGNNVFISAQGFGINILDTLNFKTNFEFTYNKEYTVNLVNPALKSNSGYAVSRSYADSYLFDFDTSKVIVLGTNENGNVNFMKQSYGKGQFYINTVPYAFTNFNMLEHDNYEYVFKALSYLPEQAVIWDEYYKAGNTIASSPLRYILSQPSLKWGYYILIGSIFFFLVIEWKRRQRIIPVIKQLENSTLEFVRTVGRLYYLQGNHKKAAMQKSTYFLEYLRTNFNIRKDEISEESIKRISEKTGHPEENLKRIFRLVESCNSRAVFAAEDLKIFNKLLEEFYNIKSSRINRPA